jgi:putative intracellular protease/amidase
MAPSPDPQDPLMVLIYPEFTEFEIAVATTLLSRRYTLQYVAPTLAPVRSEGGLKVLPDLTLEQVVPEQAAALIVAAALDMQSALENAVILDLIRAMDHAGKLVAAICGAPMLLAKAGVLRNRLYTVSLYRRFRDHLGCFPEATFRNQPLIETENLITAQGFAYAAFGLRLAQRLGAVQDLPAATAYYLGQGDLHWDQEEAKTAL